MNKKAGNWERGINNVNVVRIEISGKEEVDQTLENIAAIDNLNNLPEKNNSVAKFGKQKYLVTKQPVALEAKLICPFYDT